MKPIRNGKGLPLKRRIRLARRKLLKGVVLKYDETLNKQT